MKSVTVSAPYGNPIHVHRRLDQTRSDFTYIFSPIFPSLCGCYTVEGFGVTLGESGIDYHEEQLRERFGASLARIARKEQYVLLRTDKIRDWSDSIEGFEGGFYPIFSRRPIASEIKAVYGASTVKLKARNISRDIRAVIDNWDGIYWQYFSRTAGDLEALISHHLRDPMLDIFYVEFDEEFPDPSNKPLRRVA
jgi:hypothetical protein